MRIAIETPELAQTFQGMEFAVILDSFFDADKNFWHVMQSEDGSFFWDIPAYYDWTLLAEIHEKMLWTYDHALVLQQLVMGLNDTFELDEEIMKLVNPKVISSEDEHDSLLITSGVNALSLLCKAFVNDILPPQVILASNVEFDQTESARLLLDWRLEHALNSIPGQTELFLAICGEEDKNRVLFGTKEPLADLYSLFGVDKVIRGSLRWVLELNEIQQAELDAGGVL